MRRERGVDGWQSTATIELEDASGGFCTAFDWLGYDLTFRATGFEAHEGQEVYVQLQRTDGSIVAVEDDAVVTDGVIEATLSRRLLPGASHRLLVHVDADEDFSCAVPPDVGYEIPIDEVLGAVAIEEARDALVPAADICERLDAGRWPWDD